MIYDATGRVQATRDALGRVTWMVYDGLGRQVKTIQNYVDNAEDPALWVWNESERHWETSTGTPIEHGTQQDQNLISQTIYDAVGRVQASQDEMGRVAWMVYDSLGRQVKMIQNYIPVYLDGEEEEQAYTPPDTWHWTGSEWQDGDDVPIHHGILQDQNFVTETNYDVGGHLTATRDVKGNENRYVYDRAGRLLTLTLAANSPHATISYTCYDKVGRVLRMIQNWRDNGVSPNAKTGEVWDFAPTEHGANNDQNLITEQLLDNLGRVIARIDPAGHSTQISYGKSGLVLSTSDAEAVVTEQRYDALGRLICVVRNYVETTDPALWVWENNQWEDGEENPISLGAKLDENNITQMRYDLAGQRIHQRDARGNLTQYEYDQLNRRRKLTDPENNVWETAYEELGRKVILTDPLVEGNPTEYDPIEQYFDRLGRLTEIRYYDDDTLDVTFGYDGLGNRRRMIERDSSQQVIRETLYNYDEANRLSGVDFDSDGDTLIEQSIGYRYDLGGGRTELQLPDGSTISYRYSQAGQLIEIRDWNGQQTRYQYDEMRRLVDRRHSNGLNSRYLYDENGRLLSLSQRAQTRSRLQIDYELDARGNRVQAVQTNYSFDTVLTQADAAVAAHVGSWSVQGDYYESSSPGAELRINLSGSLETDEVQLVLRTSPSGGICDIYVDEVFWGGRNLRAAEAADLPFTIQMREHGEHTIRIVNRVGYDAGLIAFKQIAIGDGEAEQEINYAYDGLARLTQVAYDGSDTYQYEYDAMGNRTKETINSSPTTYTYNALNQLADIDFDYDANGNLLSDGTNTYTWDRANRLLSGGGLSYTYDGLGQRIRQTDGSDPIDYLLDTQPGLAQIIATTQNGQTQRYIHDPLGLHMMQGADGTWYGLLSDGLGSVREVWDGALNPIYSTDYTPYGTLRETVGSNPSPFAFTGQPRDVNGLQYHRARYYHPHLANWLSLDPLETPNRYAYANSNPVNFVDFTGLYGELPVNFAGSCQQDGNMACAQGETVQPLSKSARELDSLAKLKLTIPCGSTLSWEPYLDSVLQAIVDVQTKIGSFSRIFGNLEFRLYRSSPGSHAAETKGSTLVEWYDNIFSTNGIGGGTPAQNRTWNIVHELGHVLDNRTNHDLRRNAQDVNRNNLLAYAQEASTTMRVQNQYDNHVENVANLFMFWIYNAIDAHSNEADAARAFAEGGLIVRQKGTGNYSFIYVGANPSSFIETIARNLVSTDDSYFLGITRGFEYWINIAGSKNYSL